MYDENYDRYDWFKESHLVDNPSFFWKVSCCTTTALPAAVPPLHCQLHTDLLRYVRFDSYFESMAAVTANTHSP